MHTTSRPTTALTVAETAGRPAAPGRDIVLDALRAGCLVVVVVWHCGLSVLGRDHAGDLSMPNPVGAYSGLWLATWALQVMPLFFVVSGAVNGPSWARARAAGATARSWAGRRVTRFGVPVVVLGATCAAAEGLSHLLGAGGFIGHHLVVLVPLWTLGLLLAFAPITPALEAAERRGRGVAVSVGLGGAVALGDLARFGLDLGTGRWLSTAAAWLFAYHLGWAYRRAATAGVASTVKHGWGLFLGGLAGLVALTNLGLYPRPMVATTTDEISNLLPTTLPIVALACCHTGLVLLVRGRLGRFLSQPRPAALVARAGAAAVPVYLLHMVALVIVVVAVEAAGYRLSGGPDLGWWLWRPFWFLAPAAVLAGLVRATRPLFGASRP